MTSPVRIVLLGDVHVVQAGEVRHPRTRKTRALLAILAAAPTGISRQRAIALLWSDRGEEQARASVRQCVYELRALLGAAAVLTSGEQVTLDPEAAESDLAAILKLRADQPATLLALLDHAAPESLSGVDDISDAMDSWVRDTRARIASEVGTACRNAAERTMDAAPEQARRLADHALRFDRDDEQALRLALRADAALGDQARMHRRYRDHMELLARDLGAQPSLETQRLYERLRAAPAGAASATTDIRSPAPAPESPSHPPAARRRWPLAAGILVALAVLAAILLWPRSSAKTEPVIAVLPFQSLSRSDDPYFANGVAEEIQNLLARAPDVEVLGRASASQFARTGDLLAAARGLRVTHLLDGSIRWRGDRVLVIVRLIRTEDGVQLWSERYDRKVDDVLAVQSDIAGQVMRRFQRVLPERTGTPVSPSPAVYDRYLSARSLMRDRRAMPLGLADKALREAIALQPDYAPAHALLAQVLMLEAQHPLSYGTVPYAAALREATREAWLAARLDPALGEAQAAIGLLTYSNAESVHYYRRAVALEPQRADFHRWLGQSLRAIGDYDESLAAFRRAVAIDPLLGLNSEHLVAGLADMGRLPEAREVVRRFQQLSNDRLARAHLAMVLAEAEGRLADSYLYASRVAQLAPEERQGHFRKASALAALGETAAALRELAPDDWVGRLTLTDDVEGLAATALRQGGTFWDTTISFWNIGNHLVASGKGATLLALFDRRFGSVDRFRPQEILDPLEAAPIIVAFRDAGRAGDADKLLARLQRQQVEETRLRPRGAGVLAERAVLASLAGDRDAALRLLLQAAEQEPGLLAGVPYHPLHRLAAFRWLAGDPMMLAAEGKLLAYLNVQRQRLGWPPLAR